MSAILVEVKGTPAQCGEQIGKKFANTIEETIDNFKSFLRSASHNSGLTTLEEGHFKSYVHRSLPYCQEYAPQLMEEMAALAHGAGVPLEDVFLLNSFLDIFDFVNYSYAEMGCTSFAVNTQTSRIIGQTYDIPSLFQKGSIFIRRQSPNQPDAIFFTVAGILRGPGMNASGISVVINNITPADSRPGVIHPLVLGEVLNSERQDQAINAILSASRASGFAYIVANKEGDVYAFETTAKQFVLLDEKYPLVHANHYIYQDLLFQDRRNKANFGSSIIRQRRLETRLDKALQGAEDCFEALKDHVGKPISVCLHPTDCNNLNQAKTVAAFCIEPSCQKMLAVIGNPCSTEVQTIGF